VIGAAGSGRRRRPQPVRRPAIAVFCAVIALATAGCSEWPWGDDQDGAGGPSQGAATETPRRYPGATETPLSVDEAEASYLETERVIGTGVFVNTTAAARKALRVEEDGTITLNFVEVPIKDVAAVVLGKTLKLNYAIDPKVQGTVTLRSARPLARAALLPTLESVLRLNGVVIVEQNGLFRLIPEAEALAGNVVPRLGADGAEREATFGVQVIPLQHTAATEMAGILEPLSRAGTVLRVDTERNLLLVAGTKQERLNLLQIVEIFDVNTLEGMSFALVPLRAATPEVVIRDLEKILGQDENKELVDLVRFVPIERTNAILVMTPNPDYLGQAEEWIERLDVGTDSNERRLFVYHVQNSRAAELAVVLDRIFAAFGDEVPPMAENGLRPGLVPAEIKSAGQTAEYTAGRPEQPVSQSAAAPTGAEPPPVTGQAPRQGAPASAPAGGAGLSLAGEGGVRIIADDANNALLILATPQRYRQIRAALRNLDLAPLQVLIEATIAEVRLENELRYGLQWFFKLGSSRFTLSDSESGSVESAFPGFSYLLTSGSDVRVVLNALEGVTDVKVLSSPQLMVLDNRTAELVVGDQVPIATQASVSTTDSDAPIVNSIEYSETGVVLRVTPRVNSSGVVTLDIEQEVSDVIETTSSGIDSPTFQQRRISSSVVIQSGQTIALGGLIRDSEEETKTGVPYLSRIPVIGNLFGTTETEVSRTELLVLITPRVVRDQDEATAVTEELRRKVHSVITLYNEALQQEPTP